MAASPAAPGLIVPTALILVILSLGSGGTCRGQAAGTAWVRHAPRLDGLVEGSVHQMAAENLALQGHTRIAGEIRVPGTPTVRVSGNPAFGGTSDGNGEAEPGDYSVTVGGNAELQRIVRRVDPVNLPAVETPAPAEGTRDLSINQPGQSPGDFTTLRNLSLAGNAGPISVPPGIYGRLSASGHSRFVLGVPGDTVPAIYQVQELVINGGARLDVAGPVRVTVATTVLVEGEAGDALHPAWLDLQVASGGLALAGNARFHGRVTAPAGTVTIDGNASLTGAVAADRLGVGSQARLVLVPLPDNPPAFSDADHDGMDDAWETQAGLNPNFDDANLDNDRDGLSNLVEFQRGLKPNQADTDADGLFDGDEVALGLDPTAANPDTQAPTAPGGLAAGEVAGNQVSLSWQPASDDLKVSGYLIYRDGQPIETAAPIRETRFTDTNLPDGEEFTYQVRAFDYAGNLSPPGAEITVSTISADSDHDELPDEWEAKYFGEDPAAGGDDPDGDGLTNLEEYRGGSDPTNFYNGLNPVIESQGGGDGSGAELSVRILKPDGTPWANAPYHFDSSRSRRKLGATPAGPFEGYQLRVRAGADGIARVYLEPPKP